MKKDKQGVFLPLAVSLILLAIGAARITNGGLGWGGFSASIREYSFHIAAGLFFGWAFYTGISEFTKRGLDKNGLASRAIAFILPILFLITIHQTRNILNDGPATIALGVGLAISSAFRWIILGDRAE